MFIQQVIRIEQTVLFSIIQANFNHISFFNKFFDNRLSEALQLNIEVKL